MGIRVEHGGDRLRLILDAPHGNAITDAMAVALRDALRSVAGPGPAATRSIKLITIEAAGPDFSFGSSLDEHTPARMPGVLPRVHALIVEMLSAPAATAAPVTGRCSGGGLGRALACDVLFAAH